MHFPDFPLATTRRDALPSSSTATARSSNVIRGQPLASPPRRFSTLRISGPRWTNPHFSPLPGGWQDAFGEALRCAASSYRAKKSEPEKRSGARRRRFFCDRISLYPQLRHRLNDWTTIRLCAELPGHVASERFQLVRSFRVHGVSITAVQP